jgi:beta-lactamase regulating signal transducer with metallopeptidase domain
MPSLLCLALSNAVVATLLAVIAAVVARFCRRPAVRHALWLLVLLKLITPPLLPLSVTWPRSKASEPPSLEALPSAILIPKSLESTASGRRQPAGKAAQVAEDALYQPADAGRSPYSFADVWPSVLMVVWLGGALAWWSVAAERLRRFRRLLRQAQPAAADVQEQGQRLAALLGLRRCPPIVFVSAPLSPMLWALGFSPRLLVPAELWQKLTTEQQDTLLAHELAHLRRGDQWVRRLELLVLGLYWWHPVVWWARRRLQEAEEECCDALVVAVLPDAAPAYAAALVETVAFLSQTRPAALVGASGVGHVPLLKRRLTMILTETSSRKPSRIGFWIVLGLGALLLPLAPQMAQTQVPEEPEGVEVTEQVADPVDAGLRWLANPHVAKALQMANCAACHESPVSPHELQHPWKEIHEELLRVMEEYTRELRKSDHRSPPVDHRSRADEIEKLQDEIELLKVQVKLKEARVAGTRATLDEYRRRLRNYEAITRGQKGAIPTDTIQETRLALIKHEAELHVNEAELQESLVRLKQAERRLARLQRPAEKPDGGDRAPQEKRLHELEKKLDELRKEIDKLRREMPSKESRDPDSELQQAVGFIYKYWPIYDTRELELNLPAAQKAFQKCKAAGDRLPLQRLLTLTNVHADHLAEDLARLRPELVIEDEREAKKLKKLHEQIVKLARDVKDYLDRPSGVK